MPPGMARGMTSMVWSWADIERAVAESAGPASEDYRYNTLLGTLPETVEVRFKAGSYVDTMILKPIKWGEEPQSRRIARAIVKERERVGGRAFETTTSLADFIAALVGRRGAHHPATRVFQALRMEVNDEIGELAQALKAGMELLAEGGRFAVITFESVTDRIVKRFFAAHVGRLVALQAGGAEWRGDLPRARALTRGAVKPAPAEIAENPRARSAKLRAIEKT